MATPAKVSPGSSSLRGWTRMADTNVRPQTPPPYGLLQIVDHGEAMSVPASTTSLPESPLGVPLDVEFFAPHLELAIDAAERKQSSLCLLVVRTDAMSDRRRSRM